MAWEWVPPVATAVGVGVVGVVGLSLTWYSGKQGREHAEKVAKDTFSHQRTLAGQERKQQRLENAYIELLDMAEKTGHWAQISYPLFDSHPPAPVPPLPTLEAQARVDALVKAFGSTEVLACSEAWRAVVLKLIKEDRLIKMGLEREVEHSPRSKFFDLQAEERAAREALGNRVAVELGHGRGD